jgi:hypothetical protein
MLKQASDGGRFSCDIQVRYRITYTLGLKQVYTGAINQESIVAFAKRKSSWNLSNSGSVISTGRRPKSSSMLTSQQRRGYNVHFLSTSLPL